MHRSVCAPCSSKAESLPACLPAFLQVSDSFPFKWINKKWKEGFYVTSMATSHTRWAVVMSRNAGFVDQVRAQPMQRMRRTPAAVCKRRCTQTLAAAGPCQQ